MVTSEKVQKKLQCRGVESDSAKVPIDSSGEHDFLLTSRSELPFPGHYLSAVEDGHLTVLKLLAFHEQIHVFIDDGELKTGHSFSLAGQRFLTLHYIIERL